MTVWDDLETPLDEKPIFPCEAPDGHRHITELMRVGTFLKTMHLLAPAVAVIQIPNAGKRNPAQALREGITGGAFDYVILWKFPRDVADRTVAWVELKGYRASGRPGTLSQSQIDFGNRLHRLGHKVAMFFDPLNAIAWLRSCGCPIAQFTERTTNG